MDNLSVDDLSVDGPSVDDICVDELSVDDDLGHDLPDARVRFKVSLRG